MSSPKKTCKEIAARLLFVSGCLMAYILFFGPVEAWMIRSRDYVCEEGDAPTYKSNVWTTLYAPLVFFAQKTGSVEWLVSYAGFYYKIRDIVNFARGVEKSYLMPDGVLDRRCSLNSSEESDE